MSLRLVNKYLSPFVVVMLTAQAGWQMGRGGVGFVVFDLVIGTLNLYTALGAWRDRA
jgi:hypothetical protein